MDRAEKSKSVRTTTIEVLIIDLDVGMTFTKIADTRRENPEARARNIAKARGLYEHVLWRRGKVPLNDDDAHRLACGLTLLKNRLSALGEIFE